MYTPGPWKVRNTSVSNMYAITPISNIQHITHVMKNSEISGSSYANACLIAAAPELLEALKELAGLVEGIREGEYEPDSFTTQTAYRAITKAKGE